MHQNKNPDHFSSKFSAKHKGLFYGRMKFALLIIGVLSMAACKKETQSTSLVVGTWSLDTTFTNFPSIIAVNVNLVPCIANNILVFNSDHTSIASYKGTDTCYLVNMAGMPKTWDGTPGQAPDNSTWTANGNTVNLTFKGSTETGIITQINGKYHLQFHDTIRGSSLSTVFNTGFVKE